MNTFRSPSSKKKFLETDSHVIKNVPWTRCIEVESSISVSDNPKRASTVKTVLSENDIVAAFTGLVKGYKDDIVKKDILIFNLTKENEELKKKIAVQPELEL